jgi:inner membrane protein
VETEDSFLIGDYSFFDSKPIQFSSHPKNHDALGDFAEEDKVKRLVKITNGWYTVKERPDGIYLNDLRFGVMSVDPNSEKFAFSFLIEKTGNEVTVTEEEKNTREAGKLLSALWERIKGN